MLNKLKIWLGLTPAELVFERIDTDAVIESLKAPVKKAVAKKSPSKKAVAKKAPAKKAVAKKAVAKKATAKKSPAKKAK